MSEVFALLGAFPTLLQLDLKNNDLTGSLPATPPASWAGQCQTTTATPCFHDGECPTGEACEGGLKMLDLSGNDIFGAVSTTMLQWLKRLGGTGTACGVGAQLAALKGNSLVCPDDVPATSSEIAPGMPCVHWPVNCFAEHLFFRSKALHLHSYGPNLIPAGCSTFLGLGRCEPGTYGTRGLAPCTKCADGDFVNSKGAEACGPLPETGVTRDSVAKVLEHHWREGGGALSGDTLIYPCFNDDACELDASKTVVTCAEGYSGVLPVDALRYPRFMYYQHRVSSILIARPRISWCRCGVCADGFNRKGDECIACDGIGDRATLKPVAVFLQGFVLFVLVFYYITRPPGAGEAEDEEDEDGEAEGEDAGAAAAADGKKAGLLARGLAAGKDAAIDHVTGAIEEKKEEMMEAAEEAVDEAVSNLVGSGDFYDQENDVGAVGEEMPEFDAEKLGLGDAQAAVSSAIEEIKSKFKILIGYFQITGFTDSVFSIKWPTAFTDATATMRALNADVMGFVGGVACTLHTDFAQGFVELMLVIPAVCLVCWLAYLAACRFKVGKKLKDGSPACTKESANTRVFKIISFVVFLMPVDDFGIRVFSIINAGCPRFSLRVPAFRGAGIPESPCGCSLGFVAPRSTASSISTPISRSSASRARGWRTSRS